jgi:hypothetical protein
MTHESIEIIPPINFAKNIFHEHYNFYIKELDIFSATLLAKRNSLLYIRTIIDNLEADKNRKVEDYFYFINTKLELELI